MNPLQNEKCVDLHPGISCNTKMGYQFAATCRSLYKMYLLVHLIPFLVFKRKKLKNKYNSPYLGPFRNLRNY